MLQVVLIAVVSLDGRLTRPDEAGPGFASREDQAWFTRALEEFDCSVMGRATFEVSQQAISAGSGTAAAETRRLRVVLTRAPARCAARAEPGRVEFTSAAPAEILADLARRGFRRCALLGGGEIYRLFLAAGVVDALWLTLEPVVLGGGRPLADGAMAEQRFAFVASRHLSPDTLLLEYRRRDAAAIELPPP